MASYELTQADLVSHLREQLEFLAASAGSFDAGFDGEAKRLATVIRVLLHDTGSSASLLGQLGVKEGLAYVDTAEPINPRNLAPTPGLVIMRMTSGEGGRYAAPLDNRPFPRQSPKDFAPWWTAPVTKDGRGNVFSRRDYILTVSNKEGGAHVDHKLDEKYAALSRENALGWMYVEVDERGVEVSRPFDTNPALPSVRQIAFEIAETLGPQLEYVLNPPADPAAVQIPAGILKRIGRNDPCPCGSGKKQKRCHGA